MTNLDLNIHFRRWFLRMSEHQRDLHGLST